MREFNEELMNFIDASPTPFHAVAMMEKSLEAKGFKKLDEYEKWELQDGGGYYVTRNDSSLIAFTYPPSAEKGYTIIGAHTDSPHLRLKPNPVTQSAGTIRLGVEPYGGVLLNPWFDRDLSLAGRIVYLNGAGERREKLIDFKRPIGVVSSLAIHLDRDANSSRSINAQTDIVPLIGCGEAFDFESWILEEAGIRGGKLLAHELSFYDVQKSSFLGVKEEFITSARLDNLLSCFVALRAVMESQTPMMISCMDHEEVGSDSHVGAGGTFLEEVLRRIAGDDFSLLMRRSLMVSCDNAHALHPNFPAKHESEHAPLLNRGVAVKINANQRYATSARTMGRFVQCAEAINTPTQTFVTRSDMGCGSTIGPITSTRLGVETIDVGVPTLAMHSIRELSGTEDAYGLFRILVQIGEY
ncbi:MAG: M18 family aminopeptidase [Sulfuricurvum sp.]|jgi:aspartyl aminopeptidase|uniref:M18 family aminopeptidase n=1 Tax=Sulfuricurvum sp. TaxID=2025608 RepID=UPI0025D2E69E|nr:M18 family aminopeptidase [Sulfuricurvum sp.]MCK9372505.1 M18 family aminopeptidase [Sulfuricurvum sp.]